MGMKRFTRLLSAAPLQLAAFMPKSWRTGVKLNRTSGILWWKYVQMEYLFLVAPVIMRDNL